MISNNTFFIFLGTYVLSIFDLIDVAHATAAFNQMIVSNLQVWSAANINHIP